MTEARIFDATPCALGEGPLWAGGRLFWFDILGRRLLARDTDGTSQAWDFPEHVSAAGRLRSGGLLIASETALWQFDALSGERREIAPLEAGNPDTRSNDGRADRQGGFWISTMGKRAQKGAGNLYRLYRGELRPLRHGLTIPNAICFSPLGDRGYFSDGNDACVHSWPLDAQGWPSAPPRPFFDFAPFGGAPDGAVVDAEGALWVAHWGAGRVLRILPDGTPDIELRLPAPQPTCPAFGGDLDRIYVTTARESMSPAALAAAPLSGATFECPIHVPGLAEPFVDLD